MKYRAAAIPALGLFLMVAETFGVTHFVATNGGHVSPFTNWAAASTSIQAAVNAAADGSSIVVSNGTHYLPGQVIVTGTIQLVSFSAPTDTILQAAQPGRCLYLGNTGAVVEGFTITRGSSNQGGGVFISAGTLRNCRVLANTANAPAVDVWGYGGGVFVRAGGVVEDCFIASNSAHYGGGICCSTGGIVRGCTVFRNSAGAVNENHGSQGGTGGGLYCANGGLVQDCLILTNWSRFWGGGLYTLSSRVERCVIRDNISGPSVAAMIGLYPKAGGAYLIGSRMENCLVAGNLAGFEGGGLYATYSAVSHCTIATNVTLNNGFSGGGMYLGLSTAQSVIVYFNVYGTNTANQANYNTNAAAISYSCTFPLPAGSGNTTSAPVFVNPATGDFHLAMSSPGIDAATADEAPATDLDGNPRPLDGNHDGTNAFDMGACEFIHPDADSDGDGQRDLGEIIAGSDATSATNAFGAQHTTTDAARDHLALSWNTLPGRFYTVMKSADLGSWSDVPGQTNLPGTGAALTYTNAALAGEREFYIIKVSRP